MINNKTRVDDFWSNHTVKANNLKSQQSSEEFSEWRLNKYPLYKEFMALDESHSNEVVMDYGCGPGNDLVHFISSNPDKIIGVDISKKALGFANNRVSLYTDNVIPVEFIETTDATDTIPLDDNSIDYIMSSGVLHHTSQPEVILKEFFRILKNDSYIRIMVYNRESIFFHMYVAYERNGGFIGNDVDEAFKKSTDGVGCPISKAYSPNEFVEICDNAGFKTEFVGGYLSDKDAIGYLNRHKSRLLNEIKLNEEHKEFIKEIEIGDQGHPIYNGKCCGIGGVYKLYKE